MNIRGLQFPTFTLKWPNKRDQTFVLKYVKRLGKEYLSLNIDFPGGKDYMHHASTIGNGRYKKKYFEENFYFVSRLDNWKRQSMIRAIFHKQNEDVINEN